MRKLIVCNIMSLDGYYTGPGNNVMVLPMDKDILIFGSHILWNDLLAHDLVDELHLMIGPVIVGVGTPLFDSQPGVSLRLIDMRKWDDSENILIRYEVRHKSV